MKLHKIEQQSPEWFALRRGKMTASEAACIAANSKGLESYIYRIVVEEITGISQNSFTGNFHTERGNELEEEARLAYELTKDVKVDQVGFIEVDECNGCSPDGLVGKNGGVEIKCPNDIKYFKLMIGVDKIDTAYEWQCQKCLLDTGRKWWDLVYYNPNFEKNMLINRIVPELEKQEKLIVGLDKGKELIKKLKKDYEKSRII